MLKNVIVISDFPYINGGNSKVAIENSLLLSNKYNVTFFTGNSTADERLVNSNINIVHTKGYEFINAKSKIKALKSFVFNREVYKSLKQLLSSFDSNDTIIHIHSWSKVLSPSIFKAIIGKKMKVLITCHDYFSVCQNGGLYNYKRKCVCNNSGFKCYITNCDSRSMVYKIARNLRQIKQTRYFKNLERKELLSFGIISKLQEPLFKGRYKLAGYYYIPNDIELYPYEKIDSNKNTKLFYIGRLSDEKGIGNLCEIIGNTKYELCVIGDGPIGNELKSRYGNHISFLGWKSKEEINELLKKARCLIFPSKWYEGSPLTIPEVMSAGIPCIVSNVCNGKEFIQDGVNGLLFDIKSENDLLEKIDYLVSNNIESMSDSAYRIRNNYDNYGSFLINALEKISSKR